MRQEHRRGRRKRPERVVARIRGILQIDEYLQTSRRLIDAVQIETKEPRQFRREIGFVAEQSLATLAHGFEAHGPARPQADVATGFDNVRGDAWQSIAGAYREIAVRVGGGIAAGTLDKRAAESGIGVGEADMGRPDVPAWR